MLIRRLKFLAPSHTSLIQIDLCNNCFRPLPVDHHEPTSAGVGLAFEFIDPFYHLNAMRAIRASHCERFPIPCGKLPVTVCVCRDNLEH